MITTAEVEMEYKKNRQKVILDALNAIKPQNYGQLNIPSFLKESQYKQTSVLIQKRLINLASKLVERTEKLLESPSRNDPVYKILQRLFKAKKDCQLTRDKKIRFEIRDFAQKRFMLGYPPRKPGDNEIVDAINWEWIINCAKRCLDNIVIVSRDTDYGEHHKNRSFLNDWLYQEFKERVSHKRSITFTRRLAEGFKLAGIKVSKEEEQAEESFLSSYKHISNELVFNSDALRSAMSGINLTSDAWKSAISGITLNTDALRSAMSGINLTSDALRSAFSGINNLNVDFSPSLKETSEISDKNEANQGDESPDTHPDTSEK